MANKVKSKTSSQQFFYTVKYIARQAILRISQAITILFCVLSSAYAQGALEAIDGSWYSTQWKYGYVLKNGVGTATSTNSPNFQVGQKIIELTATSPTTFTGRQIYTDGKFYNVSAKLEADGRLVFQGEKNAKWVMDRIKNSNESSASSTTSTSQSSNVTKSASNSASSQNNNTANKMPENALQKAIENKLKEIDDNNSGKSTTPPPEVAIEDRTGALVEGVLDIKGIHIGMRYDDVINLLTKQIQAGTNCMVANASVTENLVAYKFGDKVVSCEQNFTYFNVLVQKIAISFIADKVSFVTLGYFSGENRTNEKLSPIAKALAEDKFKVQPKMYIDYLPRSKTNGTIDAVWQDSTGSKLSYSTKFEIDLSGVMFKQGIIELESKDTRKIETIRMNEVKERQLQIKKDAENKKKSDM